MKFAKRQKGLGVAGWLLLILLFGGVMTMGMKLLPLYMDHNTMSGVLDGLALEPGLGSQRTQAIHDAIQKRFKVNGIRQFDFDHLEIKRDNNGTHLVIDYEARIPLMGNVDLIADFHKEVRLMN